MKFKKYLLYLLILVVIGVIAVGIYFGIRERDGNDQGQDTSEDIPEQVENLEGEIPENSSEDDGSENEASGDTESTGEELEDVNCYSSNSTTFTNYAFTCPENWTLHEEDGGSRAMISGPEELDGPIESIIVIVESYSDFKAEDGVTDMEEKYLEISRDQEIEAEPIEDVLAKVDENSVKITGYTYKSKLDNETSDISETSGTQEITEPDDIDMAAYIKQDGYVYILKYMGSNIDVDRAIVAFRDFMESFTLKGEKTGAREENRSKSTNILILGVDSGMGREWGRNSARSDINMILHINLETHEATIVTIPRDLWVEIPGHGEGKINGAHAMGGPELAVKTFEDFSGLDIDNYIITDFDGFIPLIDFLGGVTVEINENLADGFSGCYLDKGIHHLNGEQALALCRNRHRQGDGTTQSGAWAREREAAKVILALYEQKTTLEKIMKLPAFINYLLRYTWTDLSFRDVIRLIPVMGKMQSNDVEIRGVPSYSQMIGKASAVVHYKDETRQLFEEIADQ